MSGRPSVDSGVAQGADVVVVATAAHPPVLKLSADKGRIEELAKALTAAGYRLVATAGTATVLRELGYRVRQVARLGEADGTLPDILEVIAGGKVYTEFLKPGQAPEAVFCLDAPIETYLPSWKLPMRIFPISRPAPRAANRNLSSTSAMA